MSDTKDYPGKDVTVRWDQRLCIHVGECGRARGDLFVGGRQPWCQPDAVSPQEAVDVVDRCPTGSLTYIRHDGGASETADRTNRIVVQNNGPLMVRGDLAIDGAADDMPGVRFRAALCRCGHSKNKPFCDNAHEDADFVDRGAVGETGEDPSAEPGPLTIKRAKDGPLLLSGPVEVVASSGRPAWQGTKAALCRCGQSKNKPFCDGAHKAAGFQAD
ncbi:MAG: hypothetical protein B7733_11170 [Myxococcales bacterium FL481]|nr:MAG: hypothetical protein B7733_11170 [Myxococcales bacterium FL481]